MSYTIELVDPDNAPGDVHYFSASQISKALDCPRQWAFAYIAKRRTPAFASQELGTLVHELLEDYLRHGTPLPHSDPDPLRARAAKIAGSGLHHLPEPKAPGLEVERAFVFLVKREGRPTLAFRGFKDFVLPGVVGDHKTTSNMNYAKTPEALKNDVQAVLYAFEEMVRTATDSVDMTWVYYQTKGAERSSKVHLKMTSDYVNPLFFEFFGVLELLLTTLQLSVDPLALPGDATHCSAYGGCPFREECAPTLDPLEKAKAAMTFGSTPKIDLMARLAARKSGLEASPALAAATPAFTPPSAPAEPTVATFGPINPPGEWQPESAADVVEEKAEAAPATPKRGRPAGSKNKPKDAPPPASEPVDEKQIALPGVDLTEVKGAALAQTTLAQTMDRIDSEIATRVVSVTYDAGDAITYGGAQTGRTLSVKGFELFIDCMPYTGSTTSAESLFVEAQARIQKSHGVPDYRFIQYTAAGVFAETLRAMVAEGVLSGQRVVMRSSTPEAQIAMGVFAPAAVSVVGGLR